ncbi:MAG: SDR family oxidoreductase, partial [Cyclobacteriaceae bacterium]|nr:SDR family oxidoreductase [Cyclobacteriaceae bacterium]
YLSKKSIPLMVQSGGGNIVVIGSIASEKVFPSHPAYCASKAAVLALTRQIALDYGPEIKANIINPGPVDTPLLWDSAKGFPDPATAVDNARQTTALKALGTPKDIAELALFLVSDKNQWITGSAITIDGGKLLY